MGSEWYREGIGKGSAKQGYETFLIADPGYSSPRLSPFPQHQIQRPATANVAAGAAQVGEHGGVIAAGLLERVGQDGEAVAVQVTRWQLSFIVSVLSE